MLAFDTISNCVNYWLMRINLLLYKFGTGGCQYCWRCGQRGEGPLSGYARQERARGGVGGGAWVALWWWGRGRAVPAPRWRQERAGGDVVGGSI